MLPQKDPTFYDSYTKIMQLPELINKAVNLGKRDLAKAISSPNKISEMKQITSATPPQPTPKEQLH